MNHILAFDAFDSLLNSAVNAKLNKKIDRLEKAMLQALDVQYHNVAKQIVKDNTYNVRTTLKINTVRKTRSKKEILPDTRCMARIGLGTQCSRSKMPHSDYCKSHFISLPYGRIDSSEGIEKRVAKKRGRRCKSDKKYNVEDLDMEKYVQAILIKINDESYLLDQNNLLYRFNTNNEIVGTLIEDQVEWY